MAAFVRAILMVLGLLLCIKLALAHSTSHPQHFTHTEEEYVWIKRQKSVDGRWCCGPENVHIVHTPELRVRGGRYEVHLLDQWVPVPPGSMHRYDPADPSPFIISSRDSSLPLEPPPPLSPSLPAVPHAAAGGDRNAELSS